MLLKTTVFSFNFNMEVKYSEGNVVHLCYTEGLSSYHDYDFYFYIIYINQIDNILS